MIKFNTFLKEGGNIKVGDISASPIKVTEKNRKAVQGDIDTTLRHIHDSFHSIHGEHLFGVGKQALKTRTAFSGSSNGFMDDKISDKEFAKHKSSMGDVDIQIPHEHAEKLTNHLKVGSKFGKYTVAGVKKHGLESSALMKHEDSGEVHQFDFESVKYKNNEPTKMEQFVHSSDWEDTKKGIKGLHHKILLNAAGRDKYKFSNTHGLRSRETDQDLNLEHPHEVSKHLFGPKADHSKINSFSGVAELVKNHIPKEEHAAIYDKFKASMKEKKKIDSTAALDHLRKTLNVKDDVKESVVTEPENFTTQEKGWKNHRKAVAHARLAKIFPEKVTHHASIIPMVGFSPISHMGHAQDLGGALKTLPGKKHIGISSKADLFTPEERVNILHRQWNDDKLHHHIVKSSGETIAHAYNNMSPVGKKHLHILVGADRLDMAHGLAAALHAGKIKEMEGKKFDKVTIHTPPDMERRHGMSGTNMRKSAQLGDVETFKKHLGPMFDHGESLNIMNKIKGGLNSGKIKVKR